MNDYLEDDSRAAINHADASKSSIMTQLAQDYSHSQFLSIWAFMKNYVDLAKSSPLARRWCLCKFLGSTLCFLI